MKYKNAIPPNENRFVSPLTNVAFTPYPSIGKNLSKTKFFAVDRKIINILIKPKRNYY